jgi:hypothetical protein
MHRQRSRLATLAVLISIGLGSSGFAVARGANGGNSSAGGYQEVRPPAGLAEQIDAQAPVETELFVFPNGDQTNEQLERDREECHRWALQQVGFDPKAAAPHIKDLDRSASANYLRADEACLEGRNYSVE